MRGSPSFLGGHRDGREAREACKICITNLKKKQFPGISIILRHVYFAYLRSNRIAKAQILNILKLSYVTKSRFLLSDDLKFMCALASQLSFSGPVHTNAFSKTSVFCFLKTDKKFFLHTSVFAAFSTVHT